MARRAALAPAVLAAVALVLAVGGCGKSKIVAVKRPVLPIWVCGIYRDNAEEHCARRFNAAQLIGLRLSAAERLAEAHGYSVRKIAPGKGALIRDEESNRLDVECDTPAADCTVVRYVERG